MTMEIADEITNTSPIPLEKWKNRPDTETANETKCYKAGNFVKHR
jgi:hypothetical protein